MGSFPGGLGLVPGKGLPEKSQDPLACESVILGPWTWVPLGREKQRDRSKEFELRNWGMGSGLSLALEPPDSPL